MDPRNKPGSINPGSVKPGSINPGSVKPGSIKPGLEDQVLNSALHTMNKHAIPNAIDFTKPKKVDERITKEKKERAHRMSAIAAKSAAMLVAEEGTSRKSLADPGLHRQPKTIQAVGIGGLKKNQDVKGKKSTGPMTKEEKLAEIQQSLSQTAANAAKKDLESVVSLGSSSKRSNSIGPRASHPTSVGKTQSTLTSESGSFGADDDWAFDENASSGGAGTEGSDIDDDKFDMASVEIDVHDAQATMNDVLTRMLAEGRITNRQRCVLSEKFELMLQALVSFQEREIEVIEFLNMKMEILKLLNDFVAAEEAVADSLVVAEEETVEEESHGILDSKPKDKTEGDKGKSQADTQGLSVAEMSATTIRETLLAQKNKIEMQEHMKNVHILELRQLEFEKALLAIHYSRMTKPGDVQREMKEVKRAVHELQMEVSQLSQEIQQYEVDIQVEEKACEDDETMVEKLDLEVLTKQMQVQTNANKPVHLAKEADRDANKLEQLNDDYDTLCNKYLEGMETLRGYQNKLDTLMAELHSLIREEGRMAQARKHSLHETETLVSQMETLVNREQQLMDRASQMAEKIAAVMKTRKKLQEDVYSVANETNKALRESTKLERTLRMTSDAHINAKLAYDKMRLAFDTARPKDDANNWEKLTRMLQREISNLKIALNQKLDEATIKADMVDKLQRRLNELYDEQLTCGKELQNLIRTTVRKRRERQEKSEQCIKLEAQIFRLTQDGKMQKLALDDCGRTERELHRQMDHIKMQYNKVKIARAALMNDLIAAKQKVSEQAEKFKICNNEVESYTHQCTERQKEIHRAHYLTLNASLARDSIRNHALRCRDKYRFFRREKDEFLLTNKTLRKEVGRLKADVEEARVKFEAATHESNKKAMNVRERTEEICTVTEKIKAYEIIIQKGNRELTIREMERTKLNALLDEVKKRAVIIIAKQPNERTITEEIENLRRELCVVTNERRAMEEELNDVSNPSRLRHVHHELIEQRETVPILQEKLSKLEEALANRECEALEKELILKQVTEITEDSMEKANLLKGTYSEDTNLLCTLRKQLYHMSYKIDGMISEASIAITQADLAEKRYSELAEELARAEKRFCKGLPPVDSMLQEWNHILWKNEMLRRSNENKSRRFLKEVKPLSGSRIIMERLRPRKNALEATYSNSPCRTIGLPRL